MIPPNALPVRPAVLTLWFADRWPIAEYVDSWIVGVLDAAEVGASRIQVKYVDAP